MTKLPLTLSDATGVPYYRQIESQVAELIRLGQLPPGERLPSVRELALQLRVSVITTRRTYADLEQAGLVLRRQGRGTFVADEVEGASRERAREEARRALADAVLKARRLGMSDAEQRELFEGLLGDGESSE
jgi:GntR family transcriptional regulator